ncbi:MAG: hypothetical protein M3R17_13345 [Bacteroidota bacterium]|nr:hypothetical protein [Bacteroidota bacterium]
MKFLNHKTAVLLVFIQLFLVAGVNGRDFIPAPLNFRTAMQPAMKSDGPKVNMLVVYAGVALGGKQNTAYFLKSKLTLIDKINLYGSMYYHINHDQLYFASFGFGNIVELSAGVEWGDRTFFVPKDSTFQRFHFENTKTGATVPYSTFTGYTFKQEVTTYTLGLTFKAKGPVTNFWRGKGNCWRLLEFKWEMMYAPKVIYDETMEVTTQGEYEATAETYEMVDERIRHWGVRMVADTRLGSKLGMMMEFGLRPGIKYDLNENHRFSGGYLRIGVSVGLTMGGRKALKYAIEN